jgi:type I restriction enzyme S subunit
MVNGEKRVPEGWTWSTLGEVTQINPRDISLRSLPDDFRVTFLPMAAVDAWQGLITEPEIRPLKSVRKGFTAFADGDVLFAKITPSMENGKAAIAKNLENGIGFGSTEFHVFRPKEPVIANWIFHFIRQESFRQDAKAHFAGTAGQLRVPASFLVDYPIPLPPLPEQQRIVAKIEELFTQLEAGTSALAKVQAGLRRYKASVLKAAVEGKLLETGELEISGGLPEGWQSIQLGDVLSEPLSNGKSTPNAEEGFPVLRLTALKDGRIDLQERKIGAWTKEQAKNYLVKQGDFFVSRGNGSLHLVGRGGLVEQEPDDVAYPDTLIRIRVSPSDCDIKYLRTIWNSNFIRNQIETTARTTAGIYKINQKDLEGFTFPLPPLEEQRRIVAEVERRLSVARQVERSVEEALARAARLRQAILRSAFEGRLT